VVGGVGGTINALGLDTVALVLGGRALLAGTLVSQPLQEVPRIGAKAATGARATAARGLGGDAVLVALAGELCGDGLGCSHRLHQGRGEDRAAGDVLDGALFADEKLVVVTLAAEGSEVDVEPALSLLQAHMKVLFDRPEPIAEIA